MDDEDWIYADEDFDEDVPYVELQFGIEDLTMIHDAVKFEYENYSGDDSDRKERLNYMRDFLYRIILEYRFNVD